MALRGGRGDYRGVGGEFFSYKIDFFYLLGGVFLFFASFFSLRGSKREANASKRKQTQANGSKRKQT